MSTPVSGRRATTPAALRRLVPPTPLSRRPAPSTRSRVGIAAVRGGPSVRMAPSFARRTWSRGLEEIAA